MIGRRRLYHCPTCGHEGKPRKQTPGSLLVELVLWLLFLLPGLVYSAWRLSSRHLVCGFCRNRPIYPARHR